jgi:FkbM family methyltransferase
MSFREQMRFYFRAWRYRWKLDPAEIRFLLRQLRPGDTAVDIGAHKGAYTYWMQKAVGPTGRVFSFEPQPQLAEYLKRVKDALRMANVTVENAGVSSTSGTMQLTVPGHGPSPGGTLEPGLIQGERLTYPVRIVTLDEYFQQHPAGNLRLVKCDVEGHELEVFRGAGHILKTHRPALLFECEERHHHRYKSQDVFAHLAALGYTGCFFSRTGLRPLAEFRPDEHGDVRATNYVNNFVFWVPS